MACGGRQVERVRLARVSLRSAPPSRRHAMRPIAASECPSLAPQVFKGRLYTSPNHPCPGSSSRRPPAGTGARGAPIARVRHGRQQHARAAQIGPKPAPGGQSSGEAVAHALGARSRRPRPRSPARLACLCHVRRCVLCRPGLVTTNRVEPCNRLPSRLWGILRLSWPLVYGIYPLDSIPAHPEVARGHPAAKSAKSRSKAPKGTRSPMFGGRRALCFCARGRARRRDAVRDDP